MSISVTTVEVTHDGNGVASQYTYPFRIDNKSAITVIVDASVWTEGTHFTVSGVGGSTGGTVSFVTGYEPPSGTGNVKFYRDSDPTHALDYSEGGALPAANLEASLDRLTMVVQEHRDWILNRVIKIPRGHTASAWNGSLGDPGIASVTSGTQVLVFRASGITTMNASLVSTVDPLTTQGDVLGMNATPEPTRIPIGSTGALFFVGASTGPLATWGSGATALGQVPYWTSSTIGYTSAPTVTQAQVAYQGSAVYFAPPPNDHRVNIGFAASTTSSALTFTMTGLDGTAISATNPAAMTFRSSVASTGHYSTIQTASVIQLTVNEGATLGSAGSAGSAGRAYLYGANDGGEIKLCIARQALFDEGSLQSTTAMSSTADSDNVLYAASALTNVPVLLIGMAEFTSGSGGAGSWESLPEVLTPWKVGMRKTGDVVQHIRTENSNIYTTTSTTIPNDTTIPQSTEGDALFDLTSITPTSSLNRLRLTGWMSVSSSAADLRTTIAMFKNTATDAFRTYHSQSGADTSNYTHVSWHEEFVAGQTTAYTLKLRWETSAGTAYCGQTGATHGDNGETIPAAIYTLQEIYA